MPLFSSPCLHHAWIYYIFHLLLANFSPNFRLAQAKPQGNSAVLLVIVIWSVCLLYSNTNKASYLICSYTGPLMQSQPCLEHAPPALD